MRDAFGGIVNISFIVVFMVIVNGYLAFAANYNKAFKYKNKIINIIEQSEGYEYPADQEVTQKIHDYRMSIGYSLDKDINVDQTSECSSEDGTCEEKPVCVSDEGFCYQVTKVTKNSGELDKEYYTITTAVNIDIPILREFLPNMKIFQVNGTTKTITKH